MSKRRIELKNNDRKKVSCPIFADNLLFYSTSLKFISLLLYSSGFSPTCVFMQFSKIAINMKNEAPMIIEAAAVDIFVNKNAPSKDTSPDIKPSIRLLADMIFTRIELEAKLLKYCFINVQYGPFIPNWIACEASTIIIDTLNGKFRNTANPDRNIENEKYSPMYVSILLRNIL